MTNTIVNIEFNEKVLEVDFNSHLSQIHASFQMLQEELRKETTQELKDELYRIDWMRNDVLHIIELMNFNAVEGYKFSKMLQIILKARRKVKDRMQERTKIKALIESYDKSFKKQLEVAIGNLKNFEQYKEARTYRLRQLAELEGFTKVIEEQKKKMKIS